VFVDQHGWLAKILGIINKKLDSALMSLRQIQQRDSKLESVVELLDKDVLIQNRLLTQNNQLLEKIYAELNPPQPEPTGFSVSLTVDNKGETMSAQKAKSGATAVLTVNDDGTVSLNITFTDTEGLPITTFTTWPAPVAPPTVAFSDASPGPSAFTYTAASTPAASTTVSGAFVAGSIAPVAPAPSPLPSGWGQNVDVQITVPSGLTGQTAPLTVDAGTLSVTADSSKPSGFAVTLSEP
jgi:hypothetical protein